MFPVFSGSTNTAQRKQQMLSTTFPVTSSHDLESGRRRLVYPGRDWDGHGKRVNLTSGQQTKGNSPGKRAHEVLGLVKVEGESKRVSQSS